MAHWIALGAVRGSWSELVVEDACYGIVSELSAYRKERSRPRWLSEVAALCRAHFREPLSVSEIATSFDVHPVHLSRSFREWYGVPLSKFLLFVRVERAAAALRSGEPSVAAVAAQAGFFDQSHLCRCFNAMLGLSPSEYRRLYLDS